MAPHASVGEIVYNAAILVQRQATSTGTYTLSLGAIIGIAVGGGVLIFGILTWFLVSCARRKNKRLKRATARQSLDDDTTIGEALRSTRPPQLNLSRKSNDYPLQKPSFNRTLVEKPSSDSMAQLLPPQPSYQAKDFHNSWPFVTYEPSPRPPESQAPIIHPMPEPTVPLDVHDKVYNPVRSPPGQKRPEDSELLSDIRPRTLLYEKPGTSPNKKVYRRSVSAGQLQQILSSVDERLHNPKVSPVRKPMPRSVSVLSQMSGNPPANKLPTPESTHPRRFSQLPLEAEDQDTGSVKTMELFSDARTPSPSKTIDKDELFLDASRHLSMNSEDDSLYGDTTEVQMPKALTSPSKRKPRRSASGSSAGVRIREDGTRTSTEAFGGRDIFHSRMQSDPFVDQDSDAHSLSMPPPLQIATKALRVTSGNSPQPKASPPLAGFDFGDLVIKSSPKPLQPTISKRRGHQRSKTIRLSKVDLEKRSSRNVDSVVEENESESKLAQEDVGKQCRNMTEPLTRTASPTSVYSKSVYSARPPSLASFPAQAGLPTIKVDASTQEAGHARIGTAGSYSATLSLYDYYSSTDSTPNPASESRDRSPEQLERRKSRRGQEISVGDHDNPDAFVFPKPHSPGSPSKEDGTRRTNVEPSTDSAPALEVKSSPANVSKLRGPRGPPKHVPRDSIAGSVAALRRMNSEVSACSAQSEEPMGSPTLPASRGGGVSPDNKRGPRGTRNYLSIDLDKASPTSMRGRAIVAEARIIERRSARAQQVSVEMARMSQASEIPTPDKDFYSSAALGRTSAQISPSRSPESTIMSSGLKITGLRLPVRDDNGSPTKDTISPPTSAFKTRPNIFREAAEKARNERRERESQQSSRWSAATPQPPAAMVASRPQSPSLLAQPVALSIKDVTPPRWNGPEVSTPRFAPGQLYAPSPTFSQMNFESPTRESFELAVQNSPLRLPKLNTPRRDSSFELPRLPPPPPATTVPSLRTGTQGKRKASGKTRTEELKWTDDNSQAAKENSVLDLSPQRNAARDSLGMYDSDGFLKSSPERNRKAVPTVTGMENMI